MPLSYVKEGMPVKYAHVYPFAPGCVEGRKYIAYEADCYCCVEILEQCNEHDRMRIGIFDKECFEHINEVVKRTRNLPAWW